MDNEKLNEKLVKFARFPYKVDPLLKTDHTHFQTPDLTESLDACFKYLVPEVYEKYGEVKTRELLEVWAWYVASGAYWGKEAKALCLAIERLMEAENE